MRKSRSQQQGNASLTALADVIRRGGQIIESMQRDALLLARVHQELAAAIVGLCDQTIGARESTEPASSADPPTPRMLRILDVSKRVGLGRSSIWKMVKEGHFPPPRRLSQRSVGWFELDIEQWLRSRRATQ
jgi:prophage regulatory protein